MVDPWAEMMAVNSDMKKADLKAFHLGKMRVGMMVE